ncbi:hypothetical protein BDA96_09G211500 [Sorghum bicolor]|uniref:Uncharacterized protein n=2 Tax=Sorghum bicolor TaxID=4558 RepID=A0A921QEG8_SORBI|nr:hypothetical protein BDA96_09G211500 [Sorghum bicolor]OQU78313.1 hypothetical protein SORBI_3009G200566 [Sorghum bicolor]
MQTDKCQLCHARRTRPWNLLTRLASTSLMSCSGWSWTMQPAASEEVEDQTMCDSSFRRWLPRARGEIQRRARLLAATSDRSPNNNCYVLAAHGP